ncbi:hypothetical protein A5881_001289 [Enterococcus termitis]
MEDLFPKRMKKEDENMKGLNVVRTGIGMSQKMISPYIKNGVEIIVDSKGDLPHEELKNKGYKVKVLDSELNKSSLFDPYKALNELAEEKPVKFVEVANELEKTIKIVYSESVEKMVLDETHNEMNNFTSSLSYSENDR